MVSKQLPDGIYELFTHGEDMANGAHNHEATVGLKQNKEVDLRADLAPAIAAQKDYRAVINANTALSTAVTIADSNGKAFLGSARRVLASNFGERFNQSWAAAGFSDNSTAVPNTQPRREALLLSLRDFFTDNPSYEVSTPKVVVTAAAAGTLHIALTKARAEARDGNALASQRKMARDAAEKKLRERMSGMIAELGQLLEDDDPMWLAFGLNEPGATNAPDSADGLALAAGPAGTVLAHWTRTPRATRYRVFVQIIGVDDTPVNVKTVSDPETTLTGLPSGKTVRIYVISANEAGQAAACEAEEIVVH